MKQNLEIRTISLKDANAYVHQYHRHHDTLPCHKFSIAVYEGGVLHGVAIVGRPLSRFLDDGKTLEVLRLCTDGTRNACSKLYSQCAKAGEVLGYDKIITYILESENGASLKASGWTMEDDHCGGMDWSKCTRSRLREENKQLSFVPKKEVPKEYKKRWCKVLREGSKE